MLIYQICKKNNKTKSIETRVRENIQKQSSMIRTKLLNKSFFIVIQYSSSSSDKERYSK